MGELLLNHQYRPMYRTSAPDPEPLTFHRGLPGYAPTPLHALPDLARRLGVGSIHLKDESGRFGLPAYKILGAAWATCRVLRERLGLPSATLDALRRAVAGQGLELVTATEGNHGRGVARTARWLGLGAEIHVPVGSAPSRMDAIAGEGARVVVVDGSYDDAVAHAAKRADPRRLLIQDHGWPGYETIPGWIADGYDTILVEAEAQLDAAGAGPADVVLVQIGVGTLASSVIRHFRAAGRSNCPSLLGVEPTGAACALRSIAAGHPVLLEAGTHSSIMAGLNCGTPSSAAWPLLRDGMAAFLAVEDEQARVAMRQLAAVGIEAGESGSAGLAGLMELTDQRHAGARDRLGIGFASRVLLLSTEGPTDPAAWAAVVGRAPAAVRP